MDIVYRVGGDGFQCALFAERDSAKRVAQILTALRESTTWGEFRAKLPEDEWDCFLQCRFDKGPPPDDARFHRDMVPGYADGDYPEWLRSSVLEWFPVSLIEKHSGTVDSSVLNGDALELPAGEAEAIAADLRAMGHRVERSNLDFR